MIPAVKYTQIIKSEGGYTIIDRT